MTETKNYTVKPFGELQGVLMFSVRLGHPDNDRADINNPYFLLIKVSVDTNTLHLTLSGVNDFRFRTLVPRLTRDVQTDLEVFFDTAAALLIDSVAAHFVYPDVTL